MKCNLPTVFYMVPVFLCLGAQNLLAQDIMHKRIYNTQHIGKMAAPALDGFVEDPVWQLVEWSGDYVEINIDSNHELRTAASFAITAVGVRGRSSLQTMGWTGFGVVFCLVTGSDRLWESCATRFE